MQDSNLIGIALLVVHLALFGIIGYAFYRVRKTEAEVNEAPLGEH